MASTQHTKSKTDDHSQTQQQAAPSTQPHSVGGVTPQTTAPAQPRKPDVIDPLRGCLEILLTHHKIAANSENLTAGLPLDQGRMTSATLEHSLQRAGFAVKTYYQTLKGISPLLFPLVLFLKSGEAIVLLDKHKDGSLVVALPHADGGAIRAKEEELEQLSQGRILVAKPAYEKQTGSNEQTQSTIKHWFWTPLRALTKEYTYVVLAAAFINLLGLALPLFTMNVYDRVLPNAAFPTLWALTLGVALALLFDFALKSLRASLIYFTGKRADLALSSRLFDHVLHINLQHRPSDIGGFLGELRELETLRDFLSSTAVATLTDLIFLSLFLALIAYIGGPIVLPLLATITIVCLLGLLLQIPLKKAVTETTTDTNHRNALLMEAVTGLETLKLQRAEGQFLSHWEKAAAHAANGQNTVRRLSALFLNLTGTLQQATTIAMLVLGTYLFSQGQISMGGIIAAVILGGRALAPLASLASMFARLQHVRAAYQRLDTIMLKPRECPWSARHVDQPIKKGEIRLNNLSFTYSDSDEPALNALNLTIEPGERVAILGAIGSGKSTLGKLLAALYQPTSGKYLIDRLDHNQYPATEIRRSITYLSQDATLFSGSIRDNLKLGQTDLHDAELIQACERSGAMPFIDAHPQGFARPLAAQGRNLSAGQRQTLLLARAFLGAPKLVFLDEPSGALDGQAEKRLISAIGSALKPEQTLVLATHRTAPLSLVNRIIILDKGRLLADGPKDKVKDILAAKQS